MILTVTLNVALDRTVAVPRIALGNRHRAIDSRVSAGGKGINVARALKSLGEPVIAAGIAAGPTGARIRELLDDEQVLHDFTEVAGDSRTDLSIIDPASGVQTEINERGPQVGADDLRRFAERLRYLAAGADFCVIAGSLPPGAEADAYAELISSARGQGAGPARHGGRPDAGRDARAARRGGAERGRGGGGGRLRSSPNPRTSSRRWRPSSRWVRRRRSSRRRAVASRSSAVTSRTRIKATIEPLPTVASIGSGDAFLAGYVKSRRAGLSRRATSPTGWRAAPSRPSTSAPGPSTPTRSGASST